MSTRRCRPRNGWERHLWQPRNRLTNTLPPVIPAPIPGGWVVDYQCSSDSAPRVIANDVVTKLSTNTPFNCISFCSAQGYTFAGVEYADECHCGTGYKSSPAPAAISSTARATTRTPVGGRSRYSSHRDARRPGVLSLACVVTTSVSTRLGTSTAHASTWLHPTGNTSCRRRPSVQARGYAYAGVE